MITIDEMPQNLGWLDADHTIHLRSLRRVIIAIYGIDVCHQIGTHNVTSIYGNKMWHQIGITNVAQNCDIKRQQIVTKIVTKL